MTLSILAFTKGDAFAARFLSQFRALANDLSSEFVIAGDGTRGMALAQQYADRAIPVETIGIQESHIAIVAGECRGDWILKLDDDESLSPAMRDWLQAREWERGEEKGFGFPYAWLWGDARHFITTPPFWTDAHVRLLKKEIAQTWGTGMHAGNPMTARTIPVAHLHHKFLVKSLDERKEVARRYDALLDGAGTGEHFGKFTLPEIFCKRLWVREVGDGAVELDAWVNTGEEVECSPKLGRDSMMIGKGGWENFKTSHAQV